MAQDFPSQGPGGTYFFTLRLAQRDGAVLTQHVGKLRSAMRYTMNHHAFRIDAIAVLPDVIHTVWTLPADTHDYSVRLGMLKSRFSRFMPAPAYRTPDQIRRGEKGIWQRRFWEHRIVDQADFVRHCDLVHLAPVHAGLCDTPQDWQYSSVHRALVSSAHQALAGGPAAPLPTTPPGSQQPPQGASPETYRAAALN